MRDAGLPGGRLVVRLTGHVVAVIDGVIHDTFDPFRGEGRAVYAYWAPAPDHVDVARHPLFGALQQLAQRPEWATQLLRVRRARG